MCTSPGSCFSSWHQLWIAPAPSGTTRRCPCMSQTRRARRGSICSAAVRASSISVRLPSCSLTRRQIALLVLLWTAGVDEDDPVAETSMNLLLIFFSTSIAVIEAGAGYSPPGCDLNTYAQTQIYIESIANM